MELTAKVHTIDSFRALLDCTEDELMDEINGIGFEIAYAFWQKLSFAEVPNSPELQHIHAALLARWSVDLDARSIGTLSDELPIAVCMFYESALQILEKNER